MWLLDTNVISELRKAPSGQADPYVVAWAEAQDTQSMFVSVITLFELELGVRQMERRDGKQGRALRAWLDTQVRPAFEGRMLPIDDAVAKMCAGYHVPDPRPERDAFIAANAAVHHLKLATRNGSDFKGLDIDIVNPWDP